MMLCYMFFSLFPHLGGLVVFIFFFLKNKKKKKKKRKNTIDTFHEIHKYLSCFSPPATRFPHVLFLIQNFSPNRPQVFSQNRGLPTCGLRVRPHAIQPYITIQTRSVGLNINTAKAAAQVPAHMALALVGEAIPRIHEQRRRAEPWTLAAQGNEARGTSYGCSLALLHVLGCTVLGAVPLPSPVLVLVGVYSPFGAASILGDGGR